jgi:hypothetical protein
LGTLASMVRRKTKNSSCRCLGSQWPKTFPVATSKAANSVVLPFRHDQMVRQLGSLTEHINTPHIYFGDTH